MILLNNIEFSLPFKDPVLIFSLVLFIILLAPILLKKARLPSVVGLIIAGVLVGEHGFNFLHRDEGIILFEKIGLLYIMFLAGLEIDLNDFKKNRNRSIVFGGFTFFIPLLLGLPICYYILELDILATIMVASMFATHTLVAYPIASRLGIIRNEAVVLAVGGTIITDTAVLIVFSGVVAANSGNLDAEFWLFMVLKMAIFAFIVIYLFPRIGRWFFKKIEGENTSHYIFVLALVFFAGFLSQLAGLESIVGAFLAGLALNKLIPHTSTLMNRIVFVGNALFIPFFLISVGMLVDLGILFKGTTSLIFAGTLTLTAMSGKYIAAFITQKIYGHSLHQRHVLFGLTNAHAAATLAIILVGRKINIIDDTVLNGTILLILVTCLVGSFAVESAGRKLALEDAEEPEPSDDFKDRILIPINNPSTMERLIDFAVMIKSPKDQNPIFPLAVVNDDEEAQEKVMMSNKMLEKAKIHASAGENIVQVMTRVDLNPASGIVRAAKELVISDIILGWNKHSKTSELIFGNILDNLVQNSGQGIYCCKLLYPINTMKRLVVVVPENAEVEVGFLAWVMRLKYLAHQLGAQILFLGGDASLEKITFVESKLKPQVVVLYKKFTDWDNLDKLLPLVSADDLLVFITARKGTISHHIYLESLENQLIRYFGNFSHVIIYPKQYAHDGSDNTLKLDGMMVSPIQENIERISKISRKVKEVFSKSQEEAERKFDDNKKENNESN
jgi:Kef-type K+ transport system membrane component KefB